MEEDIIGFKEKIIRHYLNEATANACMTIINTLEKMEEHDYEEELDVFIYASEETMDDTNRAANIVNTLKKYGFKLLRILGVYLSNDFDDKVSVNFLANVVDFLTTINELDINDSLFILSLKDDDDTDMDKLLHMFTIEEEVDIFLLNNLIDDVSPLLLESIFGIVNKNLEKADIAPIDLRVDNLDRQSKIMGYLTDNLTIEIPEEIIHTLLEKDYVEGLNSKYIEDLIKPIKFNIQRYINEFDEPENDKIKKYMVLVGASLVYLYKLNHEEHYVLHTLSILQNYLPDESIMSSISKEIREIEKIYQDSGLYEFINIVEEEDNEQ